MSPSCPSSGELEREEAMQVAMKERPVSQLLMQEKMAKVPNQQGSVLMGDGAAPIRYGPAQVEAAVVDAMSCANGIRVNTVDPQLEDASGGDASVPGSLAPACLGMSPRVSRYHPPGPQTSWIQGQMSWGSQVTRKRCPRLSAGGRWREAWSLRVHESQSQVGCCR
jgi:hypothetical protein